MDKTSIAVLITTHNNAEDLDQTMASIQAQNFPKERIWTYIVDFESTDGTYEKVLRYGRNHTAIYQLPDVYNEWARRCRAAEMMQFKVNPYAFQHVITLQPGDILHEDCFAACTQALGKYRAQGISLLVCESDVIGRDGTIRRQWPIADEELLLSPGRIPEIMLNHFWDHYVGYFGGELHTAFHRNYCLRNERYSWNSLVYCVDAAREFVYLPQTLFTLKERDYTDEVEALLFLWEARLHFMRALQQSVQSEVKALLNSKEANRGLANYSLWRISKRYSTLSAKEREDLLRLAEIIDPSIKETEAYKEFWAKINAGLDIKYSDYKTYFEECSYGSEEKMSRLWKSYKECDQTHSSDLSRRLFASV